MGAYETFFDLGIAQLPIDWVEALLYGTRYIAARHLRSAAWTEDFCFTENFGNDGLTPKLSGLRGRGV